MIAPTLATLLKSCGVSERSVTAAAIYGSRVAGGSTAGSDIDLFVLCEAPRRRVRLERWDVLLVPSGCAEEFQHEEVASHIQRFGRWVHGTPSCIGSPTYRRAQDRKDQRIRRALVAIEAARWSLSTPRLQRHVSEIALQLERWAILRDNQPLPSTPTVRCRWNERSHADRVSLLETFGALEASTMSLLVAAHG